MDWIADHTRFTQVVVVVVVLAPVSGKEGGRSVSCQLPPPAGIVLAARCGDGWAPGDRIGDETVGIY